jgi:hypothetical protein
MDQCPARLNVFKDYYALQYFIVIADETHDCEV